MLESHYAVTVIFRVLSSVTCAVMAERGLARQRSALRTILIRLSPKKRRAEKREKQERETSENQFSEQRAHVFPGGPGSKSKWKRGTRDREWKNRGFIKVLGGKTWRGEVEPLWRFDWMRKPRQSGQFILNLFFSLSGVFWIIEIVGRGHCVKGCSHSLALWLTPPLR